MEEAYAYFPQWSRTPATERIRMLLDVARILRVRKFEFNAWLVVEAGKTWPEAEGETAEAIDFCEYYAREMARLAGPQPTVQLPGEHDEMIYIPLGVGVVIPPWNFPLAILAGMTAATLVTGNTAIIKPSSETPTIAAKFAEVLLEAGFPRAFVHAADRQRRGGGRCAGGASEDALRRLHRVARRRPAHQRTGREDAAGADLDQARGRGNGRQGRHRGGRELRSGKGRRRRAGSAFGYQGQKCSACSRAIVDAKIYDEFLEKLTAKAKASEDGADRRPGELHGSGDQRERAQDHSEIHRDRQEEGRLVAGDGAAPEGGYFVPPTIIADVDAKARIFQEEIFGPVLAVTKAENFEHGLELANDTQYGLTGAVFSNDPQHLKDAKERFHVGNLYLNRKCTGAMVGAHPFGGFNMSGTDSKAGGPDYLLLFLQGKSVATRL